MTGGLFDDLPIDDVRKPKAKERPVEPPKPDPVGESLIEKQLVASDFTLNLNKGLTVAAGMEMGYPWNLPSRLFQFPIEVTDQFADGGRRIGLLHPLLIDHPFVKHVETALGISLDPNGAPNEYGYSKTEAGQWWHAVDLVSRGMWRELLDTARFTTPENIAGAVSYGLEYSPYEGKKRDGHLSTTEAREIMAAIDSAEPIDRVEAVRRNIACPSPSSSDKGKERWPINAAASNEPSGHAWALIVGLEAGWFAHDRAGFVGWTEMGRTRFPPEPRVEREPEPYVPPPSIERKVVAEQISRRPQRIMTRQLDLF